MYYKQEHMQENKVRRSPKRLILDIPEDFHVAIKKSAIERGITMKTWVLRALMEEIKKQDSFNNN